MHREKPKRGSKPTRWSLKVAAIGQISESDDRFVITLTGAATADVFRAKFDFAPEINALTALSANNPLTFVSGKLFLRKIHVDPLRLK
jgi:hypothetical protein